MLQLLNRPVPQESGETGQAKLDLREVLHFIWRQWTFIAAVVALFLLLGAVQLARQVAVYTAITQILLDPRKERAAGSDAILSDISLDLPMVESQLAILRSPSLLRRVVDKERLTLDPEFGNAGAPATPGWSLMGSIGSLLGASNPPDIPVVPATVIPADVMASTMALAGSMTAFRAGQGYVLSITVTSVDPGRAARLANAIADAYAVDKLDARYEAARRASSWLGDRLEELRGQLRQSEEAVARYRAEKGILQSNSSLTLNQQQLADLNNRLIAARGETAEKKSRYDIIRGANGRVQNLPDIMNNGSIAGLRAQFNSVSQREADLMARYSDRHPLVVNVRAEKADIERSINVELQRLAESVKNDYELARAREEAIAKAIKDGAGKTEMDNETAINLRDLERTAAVNKSMFEDFLQRSRITKEQATFEPNDVRVIAPALPPGGPSAPVKSRVLGMFLLIGLVAGFGGAVAIEALNAGYTTPKQVEDELQAPLLTSVSYMPTQELIFQGRVFPLALYPVVKPLSRMSEAIRTLRSGIQMTDVDNPPKIIQFCSTMPSEGKTTIAMATAASAAKSGLKVLLIDADLRHPSSSRLTGRDKDPGLVDYLIGVNELNEIVKMFPEGQFWVLPAGGKTQNPPDLLGSDKFKNLLGAVRKSFDLIIVDTPPIGPVIDASVVAQFVDKVVFVIKWAATARELVQRSIQQLAGHKKIAGVVFNSVNESRAQKYGKYAYGFYYGNRYYKKYYSES
jgi:succinoglycan biosynthesis transport protein ExoP